MVKPYTEEKISETRYIRKFSPDVFDEELKWHWDEEERIIKSTFETNWMFQLDNNLPVKIEGEIRIPKGEWHRLIKGDGILELEITKIKDI